MPTINDIKIVKKNEDYLIIDKPSGLLTHPIKHRHTPALTDLLIKKYPEIKKVGEDSQRPGIVHRLDKEASGLLVVARTQPMFHHLKEQFKKRQVEKEYLVLVHGRVKADSGQINFPLGRSKNTARMAARAAKTKGQINSQGREALTEFWVKQRFINFTLLRVKIYTGRTHQIRAHMLAYDHPVVGDKIYQQRKQNRKRETNRLRLFLHCSKLGFIQLNKNKAVFTSPLPSELKNILKIIK